MTRADPERLLQLLRVPRERAAARRALGADLEPALAELERRGYVVRSDRDRLHLDRGQELFDLDGFEARRTSRLGTPLETWNVAGSAMDLARDGLHAGCPHGATWIAEEQTAGRGRQGRTWSCARSAGLLVAGVLRADVGAAARPLWLPLALALGACEALRAATGRDVRTKWPNDLVLEGFKLGGLLVEARAGGIVFGLGLNVRSHAASGVPDVRAAALGDGLSREALLAEILAGMERRFEDWRRGAALRDAWLGLDIVPGRELRLERGAATHAARARTVNADGLLDVVLEDGTACAVAVGEVRLV